MRGRPRTEYYFMTEEEKREYHNRKKREQYQRMKAMGFYKLRGHIIKYKLKNERERTD